VIALISPNYQNGDQTYEGIVRRIRQAVAQRITPRRWTAPRSRSRRRRRANVRWSSGALQLRREFGLRLQAEEGTRQWKITSAEELGARERNSLRMAARTRAA
jgi:hypothetical protein